MARTYRLRRVPNGRSNRGDIYYNYVFSVPPEIATAVPEGMEFTCTWDETGIHFLPVSEEDLRAAPSWAAANGKIPEEQKPERPPKPKAKRKPKAKAAA